MAAEKLTKARLGQIIVMMIVLVSAFIWGTITRTDEKEVYSCGLIQDRCEASIEQTKVMIIRLNTDDQTEIQFQSTQQPIGLFSVNENAQLIPLKIHHPEPDLKQNVGSKYVIPPEYMKDKANDFMFIFPQFHILFSLSGEKKVE